MIEIGNYVMCYEYGLEIGKVVNVYTDKSLEIEFFSSTYFCSENDISYILN